MAKKEVLNVEQGVYLAPAEVARLESEGYKFIRTRKLGVSAQTCNIFFKRFYDSQETLVLVRDIENPESNTLIVVARLKNTLRVLMPPQDSVIRITYSHEFLRPPYYKTIAALNEARLRLSKK